MAFSSAIVEYGSDGDKLVNRGTYTNTDASTGGDIDTGLSMCESLILQPKGATVEASNNAVNETFSVAGSAVTVVTTANEIGTWEARGY